MRIRELTEITGTVEALAFGVGEGGTKCFLPEGVAKERGDLYAAMGDCPVEGRALDLNARGCLPRYVVVSSREKAPLVEIAYREEVWSLPRLAPSYLIAGAGEAGSDRIALVPRGEGAALLFHAPPPGGGYASVAVRAGGAGILLPLPRSAAEVVHSLLLARSRSGRPVEAGEVPLFFSVYSVLFRALGPGGGR